MSATKTGRMTMPRPNLADVRRVRAHTLPASTDFHVLEMRALAHLQADMIAALGGSLEPWQHRCHEASLELVKKYDWSVLGAGRARVARGYHPQVRSQHSWVVVGASPYSERALIVDPTLWCHDLVRLPYIYVQTAARSKHVPKGKGSIWVYGRPRDPVGAIIQLRTTALSREARDFLAFVGPLDWHGWYDLANSPVEGWPAKEIFTAMEEHPRLHHLVPIDVIGMLTEKNPGGLYF